MRRLPSEKQIQRFADILENIDRIERFTTGLDADSLARNEQAFYAVLHALLIISEAARRLGNGAEPLGVRSAVAEHPQSRERVASCL